MAGINGMGFENYRILENLAKNGYVVVSIWSVGLYPGNMTNEKKDMMEQVYDAEFALKKLKDQYKIKIDFEKIGILGCSWGGMSAAVLINRNPTIRTFVSLDGSETHYFGESVEESNYLDDIHNSSLLNPEEKSITYLYLESGDKLDDYTPNREYHYYKNWHQIKNTCGF
jgi:dipeptidyl aminopeptidase/acylaminoacyl peptidase